MAGGAKLDLKRELKEFYLPSARAISAVDVPPFGFLMVDGKGDPNTTDGYRNAVEALFATAYAVKFASKTDDRTPDFAVMPLEGLWWSDDMDDFASGNRANWRWTMMIAQPDFVSADDVDRAKANAAAKKELPALPLLRFERFHEGPAAQILYVGPYSEEGPTIAAIHEFIESGGHSLTGRHHEIYLSDPRRTDPKKLKTVIRQPFK